MCAGIGPVMLGLIGLLTFVCLYPGGCNTPGASGWPWWAYALSTALGVAMIGYGYKGAGLLEESAK